MPSTALWLLLAFVLTTLLAVGRWTQQPAAPTLAGQPGRPAAAPAARRAAAGRVALPRVRTNVPLASAAL
ncbi:MAG: hypothetical protein EOO59_06230 [Hymenobacter sp.]|nr:MAG: hypothetical protein EOO59_06230 [Hymenobacter sp.]